MSSWSQSQKVFVSGCSIVVVIPFVVLVVVILLYPPLTPTPGHLSRYPRTTTTISAVTSPSATTMKAFSSGCCFTFCQNQRNPKLIFCHHERSLDTIVLT